MKIPTFLQKYQHSSEKEPAPPQDHKFRLGWKKWRNPMERRMVIGLFVLEFPLTVAALALTGIADPNTYRDRLWGDGYQNGFNSSPKTPLYAYANHRPVDIPLVWSHFLTQFNLVASVLSMFFLLAKSCMIFVGWMAPALSLVLHGILIGVYAYAIKGQTSPDTIDPLHINNGPPWFITKSCSVVFYKSNYGYCQQAKGLFYVFVFLLAFFALNALFAIHSILFAPEKSAKPAKRAVSVRDSPPLRQTKMMQEEPQWEMVAVPETPGLSSMKTPMTPRTKAFNALDGGHDLPLRERAAAYGGYYPPPPKQSSWRR